MQETWVRSLGWEDPMEKRITAHASILAWRVMDREAWQLILHGVAMNQLTNTFTSVITNEMFASCSCSLSSIGLGEVTKRRRLLPVRCISGSVKLVMRL